MYQCCTCKNTFPLTADYWFNCQLKRGALPNIKGIGKCKKCAAGYLSEIRNKREAAGLIRSKNKPFSRISGTIYIIGAKGSYCKIGVTSGKCVKARLRALQTAHWETLELIYISPMFDNAYEVEKMLHEEFKQYKIRGEWFNLSAIQLTQIKEKLNVR